MLKRFADLSDLLQIDISIWINDSFIANVGDTDIKIKKDLIEPQTDDLMKIKLQKICEPLHFWMQNDVKQDDVKRRVRHFL